MADIKTLLKAKQDSLLSGDLALMVQRHASGQELIDAQWLGGLMRQECVAPTPNKDKYIELASRLADWVVQDFESKLHKLTNRGGVTSMMLATPRTAYDYRLYKQVPISEMREKLPGVGEKIRRGDLARFVHLITAVHAYGACLFCGSRPQFSAMDHSKMVLPMRLSLQIPQRSLEAAAPYLHQAEVGVEWYPIAGFCGRPGCDPTCQNCNHAGPEVFDLDWMKATKEDKMCVPCASKQLANVKRPKFTKAEQRKLGRLIIS